MVIKGKQRSGARSLAKHLGRSDHNETVDLVELRGVAARSLRGALCEIEAVAAGTRCKQALYHAMINTHPDEPLTAPQWARAVDRLEDELGLTGQPRAIVRHVKDGREHLHVVWSRIDIDRMKAIPLGHNYAAHERVSRALERDFGHRTVKGVHTGDRSEPRPVAAIGHDEHQQSQRGGLNKAEVEKVVTAAWRSTESARDFVSALEEHGYALARGDRRDFVVIDPAGTAHSPRRRIEGVKAAEVNSRLSALDPATLPSVAEIREAIKARRADEGRAGQAEGDSRPPSSKSEDLRLPDPAPADSEEEADSGGFFRSISRTFRRWTARASSFFQSWHDQVMRRFNSGYEIEPEASPASPAAPGKTREEYKPGSSKPEKDEREDKDRDKER